MNGCFCNTDAGCFKCANSVPNGLSEFSRTRGAAKDLYVNVKLNDGTVRCGDHMDASSYESRTDEACLYCPDAEVVTHLGGTPASAACTDIEPEDAFTSAKASVNCDGCLGAIERTTKGGQRYQVDYDESKHSWGVVDTFDGDKFISHTTTLMGARVQRRRMVRSRYAWTN